MARVAEIAVQHHGVLKPGTAPCKPTAIAGMVVPPELRGRHDQYPRVAFAQHELELVLTEDRHQWRADRTDPHDAE